MPAICASPAEAEAELQGHQQPELYRETITKVCNLRKEKHVYKGSGPLSHEQSP